MIFQLELVCPDTLLYTYCTLMHVIFIILITTAFNRSTLGAMMLTCLLCQLDEKTISTQTVSVLCWWVRAMILTYLSCQQGDATISTQIVSVLCWWRFCAPTGKEWYSNHYHVQCPICAGHGKISCDRCMGSGVRLYCCCHCYYVCKYFSS